VVRMFSGGGDSRPVRGEPGTREHSARCQKKTSPRLVRMTHVSTCFYLRIVRLPTPYIAK
jgi:hypothetical protein